VLGLFCSSEEDQYASAWPRRELNALQNVSGDLVQEKRSIYLWMYTQQRI